MRVLVACEYSGVVRDAFRARGHDAMSCDLLPTDAPGPHYVGDVRDIIDDGWDLMVAHPPCTYLTLSGVRWLHEDPERWGKMREAVEFFRMLCVAVRTPRAEADVPLAAESPAADPDRRGYGAPATYLESPTDRGQVEDPQRHFLRDRAGDGRAVGLNALQH